MFDWVSWLSGFICAIIIIILGFNLYKKRKINKIPELTKWVDGIVKKWTPRMNFIVLGLTVITVLTIIPSYFNPYIIQTEIFKDYSPENYLSEASLEVPTYILKTTEIVLIKPKSLLWPWNSKTFILPIDSYKIKAIQSDTSLVKIDENEKKIEFNFLHDRSEVENTQLSYSYRQKQRPSVVLLDYGIHFYFNEIEENFIIENTENAKITSYRSNWIVNNDEKSWKIDSISIEPSKIIVDKEEIDFNYVYEYYNDTKVLVYSWDMDFKENEIKHVKIITNTSANYYKYISIINLEVYDGTLDPVFPYENGTFDWAYFVSDFEDYPYPNASDYFEGRSIRFICFPLNKSILEYNEKKYGNKSIY